MNIDREKIIWTTKELEEWMRDADSIARVHGLLPLGHVTAGSLSSAQATETSRVKGTVAKVIVNLPPGVRDLVWVSVLLNHKNLVRAVGGDNQYYTFLAAYSIKAGDIIDVLVNNLDKLWGHTIGVRVEVEEGR